MRLIKKHAIISVVIACVGFSIIAIHDFLIQRSIVKKINEEDESRVINAAKVHFDTIIAQSMKQIELIASLPYINYIAQQDDFRKYKMIQLASSEIERLGHSLSYFSNLRLIQCEDGSYKEIIKLNKYGKAKQLLSTNDIQIINEPLEYDLWNDSPGGVAIARIDADRNIRVYFLITDPINNKALFVVEGKIIMQDLISSLNNITNGYIVSSCDSPEDKGCVGFEYVDGYAFGLNRILPSDGINIIHWLPFMATLAGALLVSFIVAFYLTRKSVEPTIQLIDYTNKLRNDLVIEDSPFDDELGEVWKGLNEFVEKIKEREKELTRSSSLVAIGSTTAMVAHDVRRSLAGMKALLAALPVIKGDPVQIDKMITAVDRNIVQTNTMLNDILEFSKDSTSLVLEDHNPQGIITAALSDVLRNRKDANIKVEYELLHNRMLHVDSARIIRVLVNILDNALDAMGDKSSGKSVGVLKISSYEVNREEEKLIGIKIADDGPGLPDDIIDRLFEPFVSKGKTGGTGLGLAICKRVIDMHGGMISAGNRTELPGSEFVIELPAGNVQSSINESELIHHSDELKVFREEEQARTEYGETLNTAEFMRINKERERKSNLIIVDDEPLFRESVRALFDILGSVKDHVRVIEADSAEMAIQLFQTQKFDYAIVDIDLGKGRMNGYELARMILKKYQETYVLVHSNKRRSEMDKGIRHIASKRFMGFLPKPMRSSELIQFLACKTFEVSADVGSKIAKQNKFLVVNDDETIRLGLKWQLKSMGDVQILEASSMNEALDILSNNNISVILSDINLGEGQPDGYKLLNHVRQQGAIDAKFYIVSGYSKETEEYKAHSMGADGYLQLPVEDECLKLLFY